MKKNVGISISKCLKSAAKNRRTNQTARAILSAPTVIINRSSNRKIFKQLKVHLLIMPNPSIPLLVKLKLAQQSLK
jgi:hypothetical protein